ncbi:MAG: hypothetical protein ACXIVG_01960 [Pararhodobacter sp.]
MSRKHRTTTDGNGRPSFARAGMLLVGALMLAGCQAPDLRGLMPGARPAAPAPAPAPQTIAPDVFDPDAPAAGGPAPAANVAEAACMQQGRDQGLAVREVVGTREVRGSDGVATSRDVMLRVARGQQVYDVRCSYNYGTEQARIMSL